MRVGQLRTILDLNVLPLDRRRRIGLYQWQHHLVQLVRAHARRAVQINLLSRFQHTEDALFREGRGKNYREVRKRCHAIANGVLKSVNDLLVFVLHQVPFVHNHHQRLVVTLDDLEDVHVLRLNTARGINHQDANVAVLDGTDGAHDTVKLQIFRDFVFAADSCRVDQIEIKPELVVTSVNGVARRAGNLGHDIPVFSDKSIDDARFSHIWATYHGKAGDAVFEQFALVLTEFGENNIQQVARPAARGRADAVRLAQA